MDTVSVSMQPQGSIFQNGFLGGVQLKIILKKCTFYSKSGVLFKKTLKNLTFQMTWGSIYEWGCIDADTLVAHCSTPKMDNFI